MKNLRLLLTLSLIILCLFAFASCDDTESLAAPTELKVENTTLTLNWNTVEGARLYTISIAKEGGESNEAVASKNYYSLNSLTEGTYTIKVKANGKEEVSRDSAWSESITFIREKETGMTFTLINGNTAYEVTNKGVATGDIVIPDTYRGLPVVSIGKKAFFNKSDVSSVKIGRNVTTIGDFAFGNCSYMTSVEIPSSVTSIGESAFASCRLLDGTITIPDGVTEIKDNTFAYCVKLEAVMLGSGVKKIGASAFTDCTNLMFVQFPKSLEEIGERAFSSCTNLDDVRFNANLKSIGENAFAGAVSITDITIPDSVQTIADGAFYRCTNLANADIGLGVTFIGVNAFRDTALWSYSPSNEVYVSNWFVGCMDSSTTSSVNIADGTYGIASYAMYGYALVDEIVLPDSVEIICSYAFADMDALQTVILGEGVRVIGEAGFSSCKNLTLVVLGSYNFNGDNQVGYIKNSSLESIGSYTFRDCATLEWIVMPSTLKSVGTWAFRDSGIYTGSDGVVYADKWVVDYNSGISSDVTLRNDTVGIADYAFYECSALGEIYMNYSNVKTIGKAAFYNCTALTTVGLPETLEVIQDYTFYKCKNLKLSTFKFPSMLTYIGRSAFYKCDSSSSATLDDTDSDTLRIPADVTYIGDYAFYCCGYSERADLEDEDYYNRYGIDIVIMSDSLEYLGAYAFYGFVSLTEVQLRNTQMIGDKAFYKCEELKTIDFGTSLVSIGEKAFYKCIKLETIVLPESLKTIGNYAFYRCDELKNVDLGGAKTIGSFAFYANYQIRELIIPKSVTSIGKQAFRNCQGLKSVLLSSGVTNVEQHAFYGCSSLTLYVDFTTVPENWHKYWNSSYRPVVYGCVFAGDNEYLSYIEVGTISNLNMANYISDPVREGYKFVGWGDSSTTTTPAYTSSNLSKATPGIKLYAIWSEK